MITIQIHIIEATHGVAVNTSLTETDFKPAEMLAAKTLQIGIDKTLSSIGLTERNAVQPITPLKQLGAQPWGSTVQVLPGEMVLLDPTQRELEIVALYAKALSKASPSVTAETQGEAQ